MANRWKLKRLVEMLRTALVALALSASASEAIMNISGTYPHLAVFSDQGEIGIGAVGGQALVRDLPAPRPGQQQR